MSDLLNSASLVLIPSGYKEDTVYSAVPTDGAGDLSFTRASNGTRINSSGLVEVVAWNLIEYSEQFDNAYWQNYALTITANTIAAPNGTTTADTFTSTGNFGGVMYKINQQSAGTFTTSVYVKAGNFNLIRLGITDNGTSVDRYSFLNLSTLAITNFGSAIGSIESVGNDWYRFIVQFTSTGNFNLFYGLQPEGTSGKYAYFWGAQLNIGSTAKPYFPTTDRLNVPRLTYQNGGGCPSLLLEPQRTNLILQSNTFNTTWAMFTGPAVTPNTTTSPDGTTSATTLNSSGGTNDFLYQTLSGLTVGATYSFSFYIKNLNSTASRFWGPSGSSIVDLSWSGSTLVSISGTGASFTSVGNDWYRVVQTGTTPTATPTMRIYADVNNTSKSVYIYGAQFEAGSYPTSYIPTTSASATRVADAYSRSLSNIASGTAYINITDNVALGSVGIHLYGPFSITGASLGLHLSRPNGQRLRLWTQASANVFQTTVTNLKLAITWDGTNVNVYQNGVKVVTNYSYALTNVNNLFSNTNLESSATIAEIVLFNSVLTDAECISLTS